MSQVSLNEQVWRVLSEARDEVAEYHAMAKPPVKQRLGRVLRECNETLERITEAGWKPLTPA